jgi:hypothetical protein
VGRLTSSLPEGLWFLSVVCQAEVAEEWLVLYVSHIDLGENIAHLLKPIKETLYVFGNYWSGILQIPDSGVGFLEPVLQVPICMFVLAQRDT